LVYPGEEEDGSGDIQVGIVRWDLDRALNLFTIYWYISMLTSTSMLLSTQLGFWLCRFQFPWSLLSNILPIQLAQKYNLRE
jgi:hypothetical protein